MTQFWKLPATTLVALSFGATLAQADCIPGTDALGAPTLTCTGPDNAALTEGTDGTSILIAPDGVISPLSGRALTLMGDDQSVLNEGLIESLDDEAVRTSGARLTIDNAGTIRATEDRGIRLQAGADDATVINRAGALILSRDQTIRADNDDNIANLRVENAGTIQSTDGRAIQARGPGTTVINTGNLFGGEEVIEARTDFRLENFGTIRINDGVEDEDGVQFASGRVDNHGLIQGSDDGIDVDEGIIVNHAGGVIRVVPPAGAPGGNGIDADEVLQAPGGDLPAGLLTIVNAGLIEGPKAIGVDENRTAAIDVINSGTLRGYSGVAMGFAPGMTDSSLTLTGASRISGDVLFGGGDDRLTLGALTGGTFLDGIVDGGAGDNTVDLAGYKLWQIKGFDLAQDQVRLTLSLAEGLFRTTVRNFDTWVVDGRSYATTDLAQVAPIPLPAALPLLLTALAGLGLAARRRRVA